MEYPWSFAAKYEWIKEHFPFFPDSHIVVCGDKSNIAADLLIDDNACHVERFSGQGLLFSDRTTSSRRAIRGSVAGRIFVCAFF